MILYKKCPYCNSSDLIGWAIDCSRKGPHISRVKCKKCDLIFANPMADNYELSKYYSNYSNTKKYEGYNLKSVAKQNFKRIDKLSKNEIFKEAKYISYFNNNGNFLDIGSGLGLGLAYAQKLGFKLYATEFDQNAIDFINTNFDADCFLGDLKNAKYPNNFFDLIHVSHVIEHVTDLDEFITEIKRVLKKDGFVCIGTPDSSSFLYKLYNNLMFLNFKVPKIIDGIEHTFIFSNKLLSNFAHKYNFKIVEHYSEGMGESISNLFSYKINIFKKLKRLIQNFFKINQWIILKKT
jgi:SAM-dependent methyltransferase